MTATEPVVVVAHWQTTEADLDTVLANIAALTPHVLAEPGCLRYEALQTVGDPTSLVLVEHYRDRAAADAHVASAHYQEFVVERIRPLLTDRQVEVLRPEPN